MTTKASGFVTNFMVKTDGEINMKTPHKHAEMIREWALDTSKVVEYKVQGLWSPIGHPSWVRDIEYRFKPEPKPDYKTYAFILNNSIQVSWGGKPNIELTFDGETGELKDAKVLK
jgi:hypothetical protein